MAAISDPGNPPRRTGLRLVWMILALLCLLLWPWPVPSWGGWLPLVWNWAHAPLFAVLAWMAMPYVRIHTVRTGRTLLATLLLVAFMAVATEGLQSLTGRTADWHDAWTGVLGGAVGICLNLWPSPWKLGHFKISMALAAAAIAMTAVSALPLLSRGWVVFENSRNFPRLEDFEHPSHLDLWFAERDGIPIPLTVASRPIPSVITDSVPGRQLRISVPAHGTLSLHHDAQSRDWREAASLKFAYDLEASGPLSLGIRIDSKGEPPRRIRLGASLMPGKHEAHLILPTDEKTQEILKDVQTLVLFTQDPGVEAMLWLDDLRLE